MFGVLDFCASFVACIVNNDVWSRTSFQFLEFVLDVFGIACVNGASPAGCVLPFCIICVHFR